MKVGATIFLLAQLACGGCAGAPSVAPAIVLDQQTKSLEGWFSVKGEWILFPSEEIDAYVPFDKPENDKCVSLVNGTTKARSEYSAFDHKRVFVSGAATRYDNLEGGTSTADRLLSKKYFGGDLVENYCLRDLVFVVRDIRLSRGEE